MVNKEIFRTNRRYTGRGAWNCGNLKMAAPCSDVVDEMHLADSASNKCCFSTGFSFLQLRLFLLVLVECSSVSVCGSLR